MAPPDRKPDEGHPAAAGLDPVFGHEGEIAAWVEWLLHPEQHQFDRTIILPDGTKVEHTGMLSKPKTGPDINGPLVPDPIEPPEYYPFESVIQGCYTEQFFDPAQALSGQEIHDGSDLSKAYEALNNAFWRNNEWNGRLMGGFIDLQAEWRGGSAGNAGQFIGTVDDFTTKFTEIAKELSAVPIAYAAIIKTARDNMNGAMGKLVDAFQQKFYDRNTPWEKILVKALVAITGAALTYVSGGTAAAAFSAGVATAFDKLVDSDGGQVGGAKWREIVDNYFVAQMKILQDTRAEIEKLQANVVKLSGRLEELPKLPV
jgi:hypothetical protein